jgi:hypothetical protein
MAGQHSKGFRPIEYHLGAIPLTLGFQENIMFFWVFSKPFFFDYLSWE